MKMIPLKKPKRCRKISEAWKKFPQANKFIFKIHKTPGKSPRRLYCIRLLKQSDLTDQRNFFFFFIDCRDQPHEPADDHKDTPYPSNTGNQ